MKHAGKASIAGRSGPVAGKYLSSAGLGACLRPAGMVLRTIKGSSQHEARQVSLPLNSLAGQLDRNSSDDPVMNTPSAQLHSGVEESAVEASAQDNQWQAALDIEVRARKQQAVSKSVLGRLGSSGPLRVQRAFYPEGDEVAHIYLLHPPGGLVAGDELRIRTVVGQGARALLTTPAAGKVYRADQSRLAQTTEFSAVVEEAAVLEYFPQETIVYDRANSISRTRIELAATGQCAAWDILCLGRPASEALFQHGSIVQDLVITRCGRPLFVERNRISGGDAILHSAWGLAHRTVVACAVFSCRVSDAVLAQLRHELAAEMEDLLVAVSQLQDLLVCRYVGNSAEQAKALFIRVWSCVRPHWISRPAMPPRIWYT